MENLYNLVSKTVSNDTKLSKIQFGYTVDTYKGVLEALQTTAANAVDYGSNVVGDDYGGLASLRFDNNDMAEDTNACIWRMELGLFGSLPIYYSRNQKYDIVCVQGDQDNHITESGCQSQLPLILSNGKISPTSNIGSFTAGCYVDIDNLLVTYMNKFYTGTGSSFTWTPDICWQLVHKKCLVAQIVPINGGSSAEVLVVGKTLSSGGRLTINPPVVTSGNLQSLGISIRVAGQGMRENVYPESSKFRCPLDGKMYSSNKGTVVDLTHRNYNKVWLASNALDAGVQDCISIEQIPAVKYYVKIYIPQSKRGEAETIIPKGLPVGLYQAYSAGRYGAGNIPAAANANVRRMLECIQEACVKHNCKLFTQNDIRDIGSGGSASFGSDGGWVSRYRGYSTAMAGWFYIPKGWPMCKINQDFGGRTAQVQREKGHPNQGAGNEKAPWVIVESDTESGDILNQRMDEALQSLSGEILSGSMTKEWYQERLKRANIGRIKVHCNSTVASQIQSFFDQMWMIYGTAASIYNTGRPQEEQVSAGEIILRCAPCLCAINGNNCIHRVRNKSNRGHDAGAAIDFDPIHNAVASTKETHCSQCEIAKNIEVAYRPMLHVLYSVGGGWGGAYKFTNDRQFDGMHIQF